jgi:hypothetical protein
LPGVMSRESASTAEAQRESRAEQAAARLVLWEI